MTGRRGATGASALSLDADQGAGDGRGFSRAASTPYPCPLVAQPTALASAAPLQGTGRFTCVVRAVR